MRKVIALGALTLAVLRARSRGAGRSKQHRREPEVRDLRLAADDGRCRRRHRRLLEQGPPGIQVEIVPVDVNSVHDKLLTSFVGSTASDIIHDEAADIAGFTQQGYLANLTPLIPKALKHSIPKAVWATVELRRQDHRRPVMLQTYNVFANMDDPQGGGHQGADADGSVDVGRFRADAKQLTNDEQLRRLLGPPLADRR